MSFQSDMARIVTRIHRDYNLLEANSIRHVERSILDGSAVTGAPGQPIAEGKLYRSWRRKRISSSVSEFSSDAPHASVIEHNLRGATLRSAVGGFHSVKLTRIGWRRIVAHELKKIKGIG